MQKFRKRPLEITAVQWNPESRLDTLLLADWLETKGRRFQVTNSIIKVFQYAFDTEVDPRYGKPGDWVVEGIKGEIYICDKDIFEATYELVEQAQL